MAETPKTSEAQRRAAVKWRKENYSRIPLDVKKEYHEFLKERAQEDGQTLGAWIKDAIEKKLNGPETSETATKDTAPDLAKFIEYCASKRDIISLNKLQKIADHFNMDIEKCVLDALQIYINQFRKITGDRKPEPPKTFPDLEDDEIDISTYNPLDRMTPEELARQEHLTMLLEEAERAREENLKQREKQNK